MKKIFLALLILIFLAPSLGLCAAGSVTQSITQYRNSNMVVVKMECTGGTDGDAGTIPNTALSTAYTTLLAGNYYLYTVSAYPTSGGTAPDAADVFILDANGEDLLGSTDGGTTANKGANLIHATLKKTTWPESHYRSSPYYPAVTNGLTLKVLNQATVSADYTIELTFVR